MIRRLPPVALAALLLASLAGAQEKNADTMAQTTAGAQSTMSDTLGHLNVEIVVGADYGWPTRLLISGRVEKAKAWLGLSFYPYNVDDPVTGGTHRFIELGKGSFSREVSIESQFLGGSFEAALWASKVMKVDSDEKYSYWDKMFGFHVEDIIAYKSGLLTQLSGYR